MIEQRQEMQLEKDILTLISDVHFFVSTGTESERPLTLKKEKAIRIYQNRRVSGFFECI